MYKVIADSTETIIPLADFKEFARVTASVPADEALMQSLLLASIDYCEKYTGLSIAIKPYERVFTRKFSDIDDLYSDYLELRKGSVTEVTEISINNLGSNITIGLTNLQLDNYKQNSVVYVPDANFYYGTNPVKPFTVKFTAGWDESTLPANMKTAIMQLASYWYENRESVQIMDENNVAFAQMSTTSILDMYKLVRM